VVSRDTVAWTAQHRYPYVMLATALEPTRQTFDYYREVAREAGYEAGTQHISYLFKVHVDETEELADQAGRKFVQGPSNPFLAGNEGTQNAGLMALPGHTSRAAARLNPTASVLPRTRVGGTNALSAPYEKQVENYSIISGTPPTVVEKVRHVLETLRPGSIFFWDGDGAMTHDDSMRSLRLFGEEVLPAVREIGAELDLKGPFEVDPVTLKPVTEPATVQEEEANGVAHAASHVGA
jgi:alkanesulfonate monooxygenase SsuD/methylene tetrahydromethanopterin reductase-like flavin-dependent oxidoreductase (luciferase family)